jgi:hypothetical protein
MGMVSTRHKLWFSKICGQPGVILVALLEVEVHLGVQTEVEEQEDGGFGDRSGLSESDTWENDTEVDMEEDESDESKKRIAQGLIAQDGHLGTEGAIIPVEKANTMANILSQFQPSEPPSPGQV